MLWEGIREFLNLLETAGLKEMEVCSCGIAPSHNTSLRLGGIAGLCSLMLLCPLRMPSFRWSEKLKLWFETSPAFWHCTMVFPRNYRWLKPQWGNQSLGFSIQVSFDTAHMHQSRGVKFLRSLSFHLQGGGNSPRRKQKRNSEAITNRLVVEGISGILIARAAWRIDAREIKQQNCPMCAGWDYVETIRTGGGA